MATRLTKGLSFSYVDAPEVIALDAILPTVGLAIVAIKFYLRKAQNIRIAAGDWLILGALVSMH